MSLRNWLAIFLITFPIYAAAEEPSLIFGIYSNMASLKGEPSGFEMFFIASGKAGRCDVAVLLQVAEGRHQTPELLECCGCSKRHVEFVSNDWGKFIGKVENNVLSGEFVSAKQKLVLEKGRSYWQQPVR